MSKTPKTEKCTQCGKTFNPKPYQKHYYKKHHGCKKYCSKECQLKDHFGENNPKWRGGKTIDKDGYIYIYNPNHPYANSKGYVFEHRLVMEEKIGTLLKPEQTVHHIDGNRENNNPDNLMLFETEAEHRKIHAKYRIRTINGTFLGHVENVASYI